MNAKTHILGAIIVLGALFTSAIFGQGSTPLEEHEANVRLMNEKPSTLSIQQRQRVVSWLRKLSDLELKSETPSSLYDAMLVKFDDFETIERLGKSGGLFDCSYVMTDGGSLDAIRLLEPVLFKVEELKFGMGDTNVGNSRSHMLAIGVLQTLENAEKAPRKVREWARSFSEPDDRAVSLTETKGGLSIVGLRELVKRWFNVNRSAIEERRWNDLVPGEPKPSPPKQSKPAEPEPERDSTIGELPPMPEEINTSNLPLAGEKRTTEKPEQKSLGGDWFGIAGLGIAIIALALLAKSFFAKREKGG